MSNIQSLTDEFPLEDCGEECFDHADAIVVEVTKLVAGKYEAKFRLVLSGVVSTSKNAKLEETNERAAWLDDSVCALLTCLGDGQSLDICYGWENQPGKISKFSWDIVGTSIDTTGPDALKDAKDLHQSIQVILGNPSSGFSFLPAKSEHLKPNIGYEWKYALRPAAISIPVVKDQTVGYTGVNASDKHIVLSMPSEKAKVGFDSIIRTGGTSSSSFIVSLHIEGIVLNSEDQNTVKTAFDHLRNGKVGQIRLLESKLGHVFDDGVTAITLNRLEHWLGEPRGYKVSCTVQSDGPLPRSMLDIIGRELFQGVPIMVQKINGRFDLERHDSSRALDLAGCFHRIDSQLNLLPSAESLQQVGLPRVYTPVQVELPTKGTILGFCGNRNQENKVKIAEMDRSRHCYVIGATGTGKSTLLNNMISQDIENGHGLCMIDPHGDLFGQVLNNIPEDRQKDVVLIDLADSRYSVGLNFLECNGANNDLQANFIVSEMMSIFSRLYNMDVAGGPVFESYMRNTLLAVMGVENRTATLLDVVQFFEDVGFRDYVLRKTTNVFARSFWRKQAEKSGGDLSFANVVPYITSKLNQFTHNALIRPIIGQRKSTIDFRKSMDQGKIILVNLAKGLLGELDMRLLGMLLIGKIFNASLSRISLDESKRRPFYLYVDEFQNLATPTVIGLLSEARKFGLSLVMANQHLGQFSEDDKKRGVVDAILGNVATMLFLRIGPKDAEKLETYTKPNLDSLDLQNLPDYHVACRMLNSNAPVPSFVFKTFQSQMSRLEHAERVRIIGNIRARSRRTYARKRKAVEEWIEYGWTP